jgi:eukaryotic-like serine/threonine-protein kinase
MPTGDFIGSSRFHVRRRIGAGAFGVVYEAFDASRNAVVAVKALRNATPDALYRFKREFRSLTDIAHRNLVQLHELISDGDEWLVSMELIRGKNFVEYVWGGPQTLFGAADLPTEPDMHHESDSSGPAMPARQAIRTSPADAGRLAIALPQLATGIVALHAAGKLHRDIKPSNVLVAEDQRVVLLDFGLVTDTDRERLTFESFRIAGTPAYMSPEQAAGHPLGPASDWYSVGVMLFETLTGDVPFQGPYLQVLTEKQRIDPPPPSVIAPGVPEELDALCRDLLRRDPTARPTADEILQRLGRTTVPVVTTKTAPDVPFIGRDRHLKQLREAFDATHAGIQTTVCVDGVSGAGKTSLVRAFLEQLRAELPDVLLLTGRCYQRESMPYKGVDSLVDSLHRYLSRLPPHELEALLPRDITAAEQLFPILREVGDVVRSRRRVVAPIVPDQQELRRRAFAAIRELFLRLADRAPVVVAIDDLQWGDVDSAELLKDVLRAPDAPALLFIASYRTDEAASSPFLRSFREGLVFRELHVGQLTLDESRQLAARLIGDSIPDARDVASMIADESGGSPFFIDELVRSFALAGETIRERTSRRGAMDSDARDLTIREVLQVRLRRLDGPSERLLELIAVNARPIRVDVLRRAFDADDFDATLATLVAQHLVRTREGADGEEAETYHDRIADAAIALLSEDELRRMHEELAVALEAFEGADAELLADHYLAADVHDRGATYVVRAAETAAAAVAFDRAARLYRRALSLSDDDTLRRRLGEVLGNAGRGGEAAAQFLAVKPRDFADELELKRNAAQQLLFSGHVDEGLAVVRTILAALNMPYPESRQETIVALLRARLKLALRGVGFRERPLHEIPADTLLRVDTCRAVALGLSSVDTMRGAVFQTRYLLLALSAGDPTRIAHALAMECGYSSVPGTKAKRRTLKLRAQSRKIADRVGTVFARAFADETEGVVAALQGRWREGAELLEHAEADLLEHCTGVTWELNTARLFGLRCRQFLGDMRNMTARFPSLLRDAEERGDRYFATNVVLFSHYVYLAADEPAKASERIESAIHGWSHAGFQVQHVWHLRASVEIAMYEKKGMLAWTKLAQSWRAARNSLLARIQFTRMVLEDVRGRAALAAAAEAVTEKERKRLVTIAHRAAKRLDSEKAEWGDALAMLLRAGASGRTEGLRTALPLLEKLDMRLHAAAVRRKLGDPAGTAWMTSEGIRNPEAMTRLLLP